MRKWCNFGKKWTKSFNIHKWHLFSYRTSLLYNWNKDKIILPVSNINAHFIFINLAFIWFLHCFRPFFASCIKQFSHMPSSDFGPTDIYVQYDPSITTVITWVFFQRLIFSNLLSVCPHNIWWSISNVCTSKRLIYITLYMHWRIHISRKTHMR